MRNISTQAVRFAVAAAFSAAFIGSALAATPIDGIANPQGGDNSPTSATSGLPQAPNTDTVTKGLTDNGLTSVATPKIGGVAYIVPLKHDDGLDCKALSGKTDIPGGGAFSHKTNCKHNSVNKVKTDIAGVKL